MHIDEWTRGREPAASQLAALRADLTAAQKDSARLDWLENECPFALWRGFTNSGEPLFTLSKMDPDGEEVIDDEPITRANIREAIDAISEACR